MALFEWDDFFAGKGSHEEEGRTSSLQGGGSDYGSTSRANQQRMWMPSRS